MAPSTTRGLHWLQRGPAGGPETGNDEQLPLPDLGTGPETEAGNGNPPGREPGLWPWGPETGNGNGPAPGTETRPDDEPVEHGPALSPRERFRLRAARLAETANGSELLGGGPDGLLHEIRHPKPETLKEHWQHVTSIPWVREGVTGRKAALIRAACIFLHLLCTAPVKMLGKTMKGTGLILVNAGERTDWTGDRFVRLIAVAAIVTVVVVITASVLSVITQIG